MSLILYPEKQVVVEDQEGPSSLGFRVEGFGDVCPRDIQGLGFRAPEAPYILPLWK